MAGINTAGEARAREAGRDTDGPWARDPAIEPWSNRALIHPAARALLPAAIRLGIPPNLVTACGLLLGLAAALAYARWQAPLMALAGFALMLGWHVADGLDGMLARATGRASATGRLLDGLADYLVFIAVYAALAFSFEPAGPAVALACAAGAGHAVQAAFYEAQRATWARRAAGQFTAPRRTQAGGLPEAFYNRAEQLLGNRSTALDTELARAGPAERARLLAAWQQAARPHLRQLGLLSANGRTAAIAIACLLGSPTWFWLWEIVALSALMAAKWAALLKAESRLLAGVREDDRAHQPEGAP